MKKIMSERARALACVLSSTLLAAACGRDAEQTDSGTDVLSVQGPYIPEREVRSHLANAGFKGGEIDTMVWIARCESSLGAKSYAYGYNGLRHTGLWQISDLHKDSCGYGGHSIEGFRAKMTAPGLNAKCARVVYVNSGGFSPWDCFTGRR